MEETAGEKAERLAGQAGETGKKVGKVVAQVRVAAQPKR